MTSPPNHFSDETIPIHSIPLRLGEHESLSWRRRDSIEQSRHRTEFLELDWLGRGAFGSARKVQHRLDSQIYCLKSIRIAPDADLERVVREVQVLSSLHSDQIVRYYSAWVEKGDGNALVSAEIHDDEQDAWTIPSSTNGTTGTSIKVEKENPTCHLCHMTYKDWEVSFEHWGLIDSVLQPMDLCIPCYLKSVPNSVDATKISIRQKEIFSDYLFILMEYCEKTLQDAVKGATKEVIWDYFGQCLKGVSYLHSKQIIHRDIKPNNIFVKDRVVKIGDFGLSKIFNKAAASAAGVISRVPSNDDDDATVGSKSSQVGTFLYMAPEVEVGRPCNEKCDVYSLGILLVEIFSNFSTAMERAHVLSSNLRNLPQEWIDQHPVQAQLAQIMVGTSPKNRPSCDEVLGELVQRGILAESVLRNDESTQSALAAQVVQLQAALACSQKEVDRLRRLLDEHGIQHTSDQEHR